MKKIIYSILIIASCVLILSCAKNEVPDTIVLPDASVLSVQASWGVVTSNYLRLREKASVESGALTGLTKGTVVSLETTTDRKETIDNLTSFWYRVNIDGIHGWVFGAYLEVFNNEADAEKRAAELR
jgi:hypothetical protein